MANKRSNDKSQLGTSTSATFPRFSYVMARLDRVARKRISESLEPYGLSVTQYTALSILGHSGGLSNAQLARRTYVSPQAMNQLLDQLEAAGFIERTSHKTNNRIRPTSLTNLGKDVLAKCNLAVDQLEEIMLADLDPEERAKLTDTLINCVRLLQGGF